MFSELSHLADILELSVKAERYSRSYSSHPQLSQFENFCYAWIWRCANSGNTLNGVTLRGNFSAIGSIRSGEPFPRKREACSRCQMTLGLSPINRAHVKSAGYRII